MQSRIAHSMDPDGDAAGEDLITGVSAGGPIGPALAILFVSRMLAAEPIVAAINRQWPGIPLIGCSTDGEASGEIGFRSASAVLIVIYDTNATIRTGVCRNLSRDVEDAVRRGWADVASRLSGDVDMALMFSDALTASGDQVVDSLQQYSGGEFPFFGGLAADCCEFRATAQFYNDEVLDDAAVFATFDGVVFGSGIDSGWTALTDEAIITSARGNEVSTIDDTPALNWYEEYLPAVGTMLGQHPLLIRTSHSDSHSLTGMLRAPLLWDRDTGMITFAGDVPEGSRVSLATVRRDDMGSAVSSAAGHARWAYPADHAPEIALFFSCAARSYLLGTRTYWEVDVINRVFDNRIAIAGGYLYGEFAPASRDSTTSRVHNETIVPLCIGDRNVADL